MSLITALTLVYAATLNTGGAIAEAGARWQVDGANAGPALLPNLQVSEIETGGLTLLSTTAGGTKVELLCTGAGLEGFNLQADGLVSNVGKAKLTGCLTKLNGSVSSACKPFVGAETGVIISNKLHGELLLHEGTWIILLEDFLNGTLASVNLGEECSIGASGSVKGKLTLKDPYFAKDSTTHLLSVGPLTELTFLGKPATLGGSSLAELSGEHKGMRWSTSEVAGGPSWKIGGVSVTEELSPSAQVVEVEGKTLSLFSKTGGGTKVEVLCTGAVLEGFQLQEKASVATEGKTKYTGCLTKLNGSVSSACKPFVGTESGVVVSEKLKGLLLLHNGTWIARLEKASAGETLALVHLGEECSIGQDLPVIGKLTLSSKFAEDAITHTVSEGPLTELWIFTKSESTKATVDGTAKIELIGKHQSSRWSAFEVGGSAQWKIGGSRVWGETISPSVIVNELDTAVSLWGTTPASIKITVSCKAAKLNGAQLKTEGSLRGFKVEFTGCSLSFNSTVSEKCEPHNGTNKGVILTNALEAELILQGSEGVVRVSPETGETIAVYETAAGCGVISESKFSRIFGTFTLKDKHLGTESITHLATPEPLSTLTLWQNEGQKLSATLEGGGVLGLSAATTWRGLPG